MEKLIRIKYTDSYEQINVILHKLDYSKLFKRNVYESVPERVALKLLQNPCFITENDVIFNRELLKMSGLRIALKRFGAYGDLLQLIPVVKYLKKTSNNKFFLLTNNQYVSDFKDFGVFEDVFSANIPRTLFDKVIFLDGVLESDHSNTNHERYYHRIHIFEDFFGIQIDDYDFKVNISEADRNHSKRVLQNAILQQK